MLALDRAQARQQRARRERGVERRDRVDVVGLRLNAADRRAQVVMRRGDDTRPRQSLELRERAGEPPPRMLEVAAEPDVGGCAHPACLLLRCGRRIGTLKVDGCAFSAAAARAPALVSGASSGRSSVRTLVGARMLEALPPVGELHRRSRRSRRAVAENRTRRETADARANGTDAGRTVARSAAAAPRSP